jgi:hypothetical protein
MPVDLLVAHFISYVLKFPSRALLPCPFSSPVAPGKSKTLKKAFLTKRVKTKREGIVWKIPEINAKHDYSIS